MNRNDYMTVSGADYIRAMFANTKSDGALTLENEPEDRMTWYMDWSEKDVESITMDYEKLCENLTALAKEHDRWEKSTEGMPADLLEVWNTYILPYPDCGMDEEKIFNISMKFEDGVPLEEEEKELWYRYVAWRDEQALRRLPADRCNSAYLIQRARRYEKLLALRAPKIIIDNEAHYLAEELALYRGLVEVC